MLWHLSLLFFIVFTQFPLPDVPELLRASVESNIVPCSVYLFLCLVIYVLIVFGRHISSKVNFIPYSQSLNTLPKRRNMESLNLSKCIHLFFAILLTLEENGSVVLFLDYAVLDLQLISFLSRIINVNVVLLNCGVCTAVFIIIHHKILFNPYFDNFELTAFWILAIIIRLSADVHPNPGPESDQNFSSGFLSFCNWNLNTLSKENFYRISLLEAHNTIFKYDIISLCETSLNDELTVPENALPGYIYHPLNNPSGERNGGVGIFYKESLPLRIRDDLSFDECLVSELKFGHKRIFFTVFYRNPKNSASSPEFGQFSSNFENLCKTIQSEKPHAMFFTGDVNAHTQNWYPEGNTNAEGAKLDELFSSLDLHQLINEPTHFFRDDCAPSCIDVILTDQQNLVMSSGVRPSLDPTVKHHITFCKLNFKIPPPPCFRRQIWHYNKAKIELITKAVSDFDWSGNLGRLPSPTQQVTFLNKTILNIMSNFVPNEIKTFRPSEPPWYNQQIKSSLKKHNKLYRKYKENGYTENDKLKFESSKSDISNLILQAKERYLKNQGAKLADPNTGQKTYWKILNGFLNKCKVPRIPPLFMNQNFITDCKKKAEIFNEYFSKQCTPFQTGSTLPSLFYHTDNRLSYIDIKADDILSIIKALKSTWS